MKSYLYIILLLVVFSTLVCSQKPMDFKELAKDQENSVKVTYIANEGVLIESKDKKVLIDGLHRFYKAAYAFPDKDLQALLENAKGNFTDIDIVLVSHKHGDHFHPQSVTLHLANNSKGILATSEQVIGNIKKTSNKYSEIERQVKPIKHLWKKSFNRSFGGVNVKFLGLHHANKRFASIQNFGHVIQLGGKTFLHIGDADMTEENFSAFNLHKSNIDVAFIPYWFLLSKKGRELVKQQFNPKHIVAVHISPSDAVTVSKQLKAVNPEITVFTKILETKIF